MAPWGLAAELRLSRAASNCWGLSSSAKYRSLHYLFELVQPAMDIELQGSPIANSPPSSIYFTERPSATSTSPTILFLHGLYSSHVEFTLVPFPSTYYLLTPDLPGHSASSRLPISLEATAAALADLI